MVGKEEEPSDMEYPQLWENYSQLLAHRQRMLQSAMAFYITADDSIKSLFDCEVRLGLPFIKYAPQTEKGKISLEKFNMAILGYTTILKRFKDIYDF